MECLDTTKQDHIAIVGSGPSGFYAAEALLRSTHAVTVDLFDRLPTPFGLVRFGVAPDHPRIKQVSAVFERVAQQPAFRYFGNVEVGRDVTLTQLLQSYTAVILAHGASIGITLDIPGEGLAGSHTAIEFVSWFNGHPDFRNLAFDLSKTTDVVVIGQGNVACDVARILLTPTERLQSTDIAAHALEVLRRSRVRRVTLIGRRGPAQIKISASELRELGNIPGCGVEVPPNALDLNPESLLELNDPRQVDQLRAVDLLRAFARSNNPRQVKTLALRFYGSPVALGGSVHVENIVVRRNHLVGRPFRQGAVATEHTEALPCQLVLSSVGHLGQALHGAPFNMSTGTIPNVAGRAIDARGAPVAGLYVAGWIKRGASGVIGTNRVDSAETVTNLLSDLAQRGERSRRPFVDLATLLSENTRAVSWNEWLAIDRAERSRGDSVGKPREKFTRVGDMLDVLESSGRSGCARQEKR